LVAYGLGLASSIPDTTIGKLAKLHSLDLRRKREREISVKREREREREREK
jgi:hypothetical protein